jgi:tetratricopeptide (TPR) repeat protein
MCLSFHSGQSKDFCFLFFAVQFSLSAICFAEKENPAISKQTLPFLHDSARIDCLNQLSYFYITAEKKDSANYYALLAYKEACNLNYIHGIAISLSRQSQVAKHFDDDFTKSESLGKASLQWFEKTRNKSGIDTLYNHLIYTVFAQSRFDEALGYARKNYATARQKGNQAGMFKALGWMFAIYRQSGDYEKSFLYAQQVYDLALKANNKIWLAHASYGMAQLYSLIENYPNALYYFRQVLQMDDDDIRKEWIVTDNDIWFKMEFTEVFSLLNQFDSARHYYKLFKPAKDKAVFMRVYWVSTGECYFLQKDYPHALQNLELGLREHQKLNDRNEVMRTVLDLGKTHLALNNNAEALAYGKQGLNMALQTGAKQYIRDGYQILATIYDRLHKPDSANFYFRRYAGMKEAVLNDQAKGKLAAYKYEQQIALINKENELQQVSLQKESFVKKVLIAGIVFLFLLGVVILRNMALKRRNEKQQLEHQITLQKIESERIKSAFQQRTTELQMQALRAQMNPHFIFNSLNSINHFILRNNTSQASGYLIKFSQLVRLILQNSQRSLISLESELEALNLYLDLEALRFDYYFDYTITIEEDLDISAMQVPPLIIQPYAENAIWHGLMNKKEKGHLGIEIFQQENMLCCRIIDDGIGRKKAAEMKSKSTSTYKSMGIGITADRIAMLHEINQLDTYITITDLVFADGSAGGTAVTLKLPVRYD